MLPRLIDLSDLLDDLASSSSASPPAKLSRRFSTSAVISSTVSMLALSESSLAFRLDALYLEVEVWDLRKDGLAGRSSSVDEAGSLSGSRMLGVNDLLESLDWRSEAESSPSIGGATMDHSSTTPGRGGVSDPIVLALNLDLGAAAA